MLLSHSKSNTGYIRPDHIHPLDSAQTLRSHSADTPADNLVLHTVAAAAEAAHTAVAADWYCRALRSLAGRPLETPANLPARN